MAKIPDGFVQIPDYPQYFINADGVVLSTHYKQPRSLTPIQNRGFWSVSLVRNKRPKTHYIHRLVASIFLEPAPYPTAKVGFIDGNSNHYYVGNLEWMIERTQPRFQLLTRQQAAAIWFRVRRGEIQADLAKEYGVNPSTICNIWKGHIHKAPRRKLSSVQERAVYEQIRNGATLREIAQKYNVSISVIQRVMMHQIHKESQAE